MLSLFVIFCYLFLIPYPFFDDDDEDEDDDGDDDDDDVDKWMDGGIKYTTGSLCQALPQAAHWNYRRSGLSQLELQLTTYYRRAQTL